jgi:uroporphyrinogen-III synthase
MKVFISRYLQAASPLWELKTQHGWELDHRSLLSISPVCPPPVPPGDWVFFSSREGVRFFFQYYPPEQYSHLRFGCVGLATAQALIGRGINPQFVGTGDPQTTIPAMINVMQGQRVLFAGAKFSRETMERALQEHAHTARLVLYHNQPVDNPRPTDATLMVFTSPMNATAYLSRYPTSATQRLIAIGSTTQQSILELGYKDVRTPELPNERSLKNLLWHISLLP